MVSRLQLDLSGSGWREVADPRESGELSGSIKFREFLS
jgi:hypothetical protein